MYNNTLSIMVGLMQVYYRTLIEEAAHKAWLEMMEDETYPDREDYYAPMVMVTEEYGDHDDWDDYTWEPMSPIHKPHWMRTHAA